MFAGSFAFVPLILTTAVCQDRFFDYVNDETNPNQHSELTSQEQPGDAVIHCRLPKPQIFARGILIQLQNLNKDRTRRLYSDFVVKM